MNTLDEKSSTVDSFNDPLRYALESDWENRLLQLGFKRHKIWPGLCYCHRRWRVELYRIPPPPTTLVQCNIFWGNKQNIAHFLSSSHTIVGMARAMMKYVRTLRRCNIPPRTENPPDRLMELYDEQP